KWLVALSGAQAPGLTLWDITDPRNPAVYNGLRLDVIDVRVECALFFPCSLRLVMGSSDGVVRVWMKGGGDEGEWELVSSLRGHTGPVHDVTVSRAEDRVVSAGSDGTVRVWVKKPAGLFSRESWHASSVARGHHGPVSKVRLGADGRRMVTVGREER